MPLSPARAERAALLDLLGQAGPDAPTLCTGWTTHDLAAHLFARERRPAAVPGLVVPRLHGITARIEATMRRRPYDELVKTLRGGAPFWSPLGLPGRLYDTANLHEMYVHHEDVRRALGGGARLDAPELDDPLWARLKLLSPAFTARARGLGITAVRPDGVSFRLRAGDDEVVLRGTPRELFLWLFGRREQADVTVEGSTGAVAAARTVPLAW
jgi:uncharacterized protein (TIGR03085 family)